RGVIASAVKRKYALGDGIVDNRVRVVAGRLDFGNGLQRLWIKNGHRVCLTVAGIALAQIRRQSYAVNAFGIGQIAYDFAARLIDYHHVRSARKVDTLRIRIDPHVVPSTLASHGNPPQHFVTLSKCRARGDKDQRRSKNASPAQQSQKPSP